MNFTFVRLPCAFRKIHSRNFGNISNHVSTTLRQDTARNTRECWFSKNILLKKNTTKTIYSLQFTRTHILQTKSKILTRNFRHFVQKRGFRVKDSKPEVENVLKETVEQPRGSHKSGGRRNQRNDNESIWPFAFKTGIYTAGFTLLVFGGCATWQYENARRYHEDFWKHGLQQKNVPKRGEARRELNEIWNHLSKVHKITFTIVGLNMMVWGAWKFANPQIMTKWFTLSATSSASKYITMLLSTFSHKSVIHLYVNMFVLSSFCTVWNQLAMRNYTGAPVNTPERYLAFYLTAGMCGSLLSIIVKTLGKIPNPSLGASGAIMGLIGYTCEKLPNNLLSIIFIPNWTFTADSAKNFILLFDSMGLLIGAMTKWRYMLFDHAGHLGGMLFGIWYAVQGEKWLHDWSKYVMEKIKR